MFVVRPLHGEIDALRLHGLELRFGLGDVDPTGDTRLVTIVRDLQRAAIGGNALFEQLLLRVIDA